MNTKRKRGIDYRHSTLISCTGAARPLSRTVRGGDTGYRIMQSLTVSHDAPYGGLVPSYWGLFEDNDPKKRLMVIANVNNDISEYWEFSDTGISMVDLTNESYKFGVNFVIYGLTH